MIIHKKRLTKKENHGISSAEKIEKTAPGFKSTSETYESVKSFSKHKSLFERFKKRKKSDEQEIDPIAETLSNSKPTTGNTKLKPRERKPLLNPNQKATLKRGAKEAVNGYKGLLNNSIQGFKND